MNLDHVFKKTLVRPFAGIRKKPEVPEGLLCKCSMCKKAIVAEDVRKNFYVCPSCNGYFRVRAQERIARIADEGSFLEWDQDLVGKNPMEFEGYEEKIAAARLKTRLKEAVVTGQCTIGGEPCVLCVMDGRFMMASMGEAVGEKITRAAEEATKRSCLLSFLHALAVQECKRELYLLCRWQRHQLRLSVTVMKDFYT